MTAPQIVLIEDVELAARMDEATRQFNQAECRLANLTLLQVAVVARKYTSQPGLYVGFDYTGNGLSAQSIFIIDRDDTFIEIADTGEDYMDTPLDRLDDRTEYAWILFMHDRTEVQFSVVPSWCGRFFLDVNMVIEAEIA